MKCYVSASQYIQVVSKNGLDLSDRATGTEDTSYGTPRHWGRGRVKSGSYLLKVLHSCHTYVQDIEKARVVKVVGHFTPTIVPHQISCISHPDGSQFVLFCVCSLDHCQLLLMLT